MIERHVYIKLNDEHSNLTERAAVVERSRGLSALPGVVDVTVGVPRWTTDLVLPGMWRFACGSSPSMPSSPTVFTRSTAGTWTSF